MSPIGYTVTKTHPFAWHQALKDSLRPTRVLLPGYAFEAIPFRWLNRKSLNEDVGFARVPDYNPTAEDDVDQVLGFRDGASWVMDGDNQRAIMDEFSPRSHRASPSFSSTSSIRRCRRCVLIA